MLNNQELKSLILLASKQLANDSEVNIFDEAILNQFKALVIPEVQTVETVKEVIVEKPVEVKVEDTTKINFLDNELQETKKSLEDLSLAYMTLLEENTSLKSVNELLNQQVELLEKQSEKIQNISELESKLVSNDSVENNSETPETTKVNVPEVADTFENIKLEEVEEELSFEDEEPKQEEALKSISKEQVLEAVNKQFPLETKVPAVEKLNETKSNDQTELEAPVETKSEEPKQVVTTKLPRRRNISKSFGVKIPENNNEPVVERVERSRKSNQTVSYGTNIQRKRVSDTTDSNSAIAMKYEMNIKKGLITVDNVDLKEFGTMYDLWLELNGQLPTNMSNLYAELINANKISLKGDVQ